MLSKNNSLPIGKLLQNAGLISDEQLAIALDMQSQYTKMKLGEILALQKLIDTKTVDFFVNRWQEHNKIEQYFPLGYYLKKAHLLNDEQIKIILEEQKNSQLKFGDLIVKKGWLEKETVEFFLDELALQAPQTMSLIDLEEYNLQLLHLERKYANYSLILSRVLAWTGGNIYLTKAIGHALADSDFNIPGGMEVSIVDRLIESSLVKNWQTSKLGTYIISIEEKIVNSQRCKPILLLEEYQNILLSNDVEYRPIKEHDELLELGIVVKDQNKLKVANLVFQQVFNQDWIPQTRKDLELKIQQEYTNDSDRKIYDLPQEDIQDISIVKTSSTVLDESRFETKNIAEAEAEPVEKITKFGSLLTLAGIVFLVPLVLVINNYSSSLRQDQISSWENVSSASKLKQFCSDLNVVNPSSAITLISKLEQNKEAILRSFPSTLEGFPDSCETALSDLRILAAPQLGKESRVIEAIRNLCNIPADAEKIQEAKIWIEHWYNSASWGQQTKSYLNLTDDCPAGKL